jgi:hypothetical protein
MIVKHAEELRAAGCCTACRVNIYMDNNAMTWALAASEAWNKMLGGGAG